ncbi:MAG: DUF2958 domain-containing protein [Thermoleophilia bacterium]|nr:DUF2958 domain-containing protein [Thermoleophilia bacterium]
MLLPSELEAKVPALYSQENIDDPVIVAHYFNPAGQGDWYIYEGQREDDDFTMFGWGGVGDPEDYELGYSSLAEMAAVKGPLGIGIERDKFWQPAPLSQVRDKHLVTKRDLVGLARDAFLAIIGKGKGWVPGPNAQWRRQDEVAGASGFRVAERLRPGLTQAANRLKGRTISEQIADLSTYDRIEVTTDRGTYIGQYRRRIADPDTPYFDPRGSAIWVTTDNGMEFFDYIKNIKNIRLIERYGGSG